MLIDLYAIEETFLCIYKVEASSGRGLRGAQRTVSVRLMLRMRSNVPATAVETVAYRIRGLQNPIWQVRRLKMLTF